MFLTASVGMARPGREWVIERLTQTSAWSAWALKQRRWSKHSSPIRRRWLNLKLGWLRGTKWRFSAFTVLYAGWRHMLTQFFRSVSAVNLPECNFQVTRAGANNTDHVVWVTGWVHFGSSWVKVGADGLLKWMQTKWHDMTMRCLGQH